MDRKNARNLNKCIDWYKDKIEYNANCQGMNTHTRELVGQFAELTIPPQLLIERKLVNYIKGFGHRFSKLKKDADVVARKWQQEVDLWLRENNLTEWQYLGQLERKKNIQTSSPPLNGTLKANHRHSGSDDRQNYQSSSSCEVESPDSQRSNQINASINYRSNSHSVARNSSSPLQLQNPVTRNTSQAEFNANLSIDPKEVTPSNKTQESPVKPNDHFSLALQEQMFRVVKTDTPTLIKNMETLVFICKDWLKLGISNYPGFIKHYMEAKNKLPGTNSNSNDCTNSLNGTTERNKDSRHASHAPHNSHNMPSTSQQGARESSRSYPESKQDRKRKHSENTQSVAKVKEEPQPSQDIKHLPSTSQQCTMASSSSYHVSKHDRKRKHLENTQSVVKAKELKVEPQPTQNSKSLPSMSQQEATESSRTYSASKHDKKIKYMVQSVVNAKELKEEQQQHSQSSKLKHISMAEYVGKNKESKEEQQPSQSGKLKHMSRTEHVGRSKELKEEQQPSQSSKLKHMSKTEHVVKGKELKEEQQPSQSSKPKHISRTEHVGKGKELKEEQQSGKLQHMSRTEYVVKGKELKEEHQPSQSGKLKHMSRTEHVGKGKELKEEQQPSQSGKLKHMSRTEYVVKGKELKEEHQSAQGRTMKCKEAAQSAKAYEFKDEYQPDDDSRLKMDSKRVSATALEARNCDKNHIKKRDSPDHSAMLAITSSKKERTSVYHGGRKSEVLSLKDLCIRTLNKAIKQHSDPTKYINRYVDFKILRPVLELMSPEKLQKLEEELTYLKDDTDGVWQLCCEKRFKPRLKLKKDYENWRTFYQRCSMESEEKLRNVAASISASASKAKPDRQIKFTTVDGPPTKRHKTDLAAIPKNNAINSAIKPVPNSCHPSNSRSDVSVTPKGISNHVKSSHKTIKKERS